MTDLVLVLDESLSMREYQDYYLEAINFIVEGQKVKNPTARFTIVKFSTEVNFLSHDSPITNVPYISRKYYDPNGCTALYDGVGQAIKYKLQRPRDKVLFIILTDDGDDNSSKNFTRAQICSKVNELRKNGWEFIFLGTEEDTKTTGTKLGCDITITYSQSKTSISKVIEVCNRAIDNYLGISSKQVPEDISDLLDGMVKMKI